MSESVNLNSVPLVYNPNLIKYPENNRLLFSGESKRLDQFIQQFLVLKNLGVFNTDHLDLSINAPISQSGNRIILPLHHSNAVIQKQAPIMACVDRSSWWFKALSKIGMGAKTLDLFEPPSHKRFTPALLFHEELHQRLEKEALGTHVPHEFREENGFYYEIVKKENIEAGKVRIKEAKRKYNSVMKALSRHGFSEDDVRKLNTLYFLFNPEEFFTTSMEAILHLKCRDLKPKSSLSESDNTKVAFFQNILNQKLVPFTDNERKLTNLLEKECSEASPAFNDMMSKVNMHWTKVAPFLLKPLINN
jgi:hypothetical protein